MPRPIDYRALARELPARAGGDVRPFAAAISALWCEHYVASTPWRASISEVALGELTYLFDTAPSLGVDTRDAEDRVVGVHGRPTPAARPRDAARQRGFVPAPARWSQAGYDRGHFVAHSLGGGMDMNLFPQERGLNRGTSPAGKRWRALERRAARPDAQLLFVRPVYDDAGWAPSRLDFGVIAAGALDVDTFDNRVHAQ